VVGCLKYLEMQSLMLFLKIFPGFSDT
jgi:hypothetical protein